MSGNIRDGQQTEPVVGRDEKDLSHDGGNHRKDRDASVEMASREGARVAILVDKVMFCYAAGQTRRWHTMQHVIREETIAAHTWNVVMWIMLLHPEPSRNLIYTAMTHDVAEKVTGDMPRWFKEQPGIRAFMKEVEEQIMAQKRLPVESDLDLADLQWLKAVDLFDAWLFLRQNLLAGNQLVADNYQKATKALSEMTEPKEVLEIFEKLRWEK